MRRGWAVTVTMAVLAAGVSGCRAADRAPTSPPAGATFGGSFTVAIGRPGAIEPANVYEPNGELVVRTMCDTLLRSDPNTGALLPGIAESWLVSDDGLRITLRLSGRARFSDGRRVTARDVVASLTRVASPEFAGSAAELLRPIDGFTELRGERRSASEIDRRRLRGVQAVTGETVEIALREPNADFASVLTHPIAAPVPRRLIEGVSPAADRTFSSRPVCSGPYRLARPWRPGDDRITLSRVTAYQGREPGAADTIAFLIDAAAAAADVAEVPGTAGLNETGMFVGRAPSMEFVGLPTGSGSPFADRRLRQALSLSVDRRALARPPAASGARLPAAGFVPLPNGRNCTQTVRPAPAVPEARALLAEAGIDPTGVRIPLTFNDEVGNRAVAEALAQQWGDALGIKVELQPVTFDEFVAQGRAQAGFGGAFRYSWSLRYPGVDGWLQPFTTAGIGSSNFSRYSSATFDRRLDRFARRATDADDRKLEYDRLQDQLCRDLPLIPLTFDQTAWRVAPHLRSVVPAAATVDATTGLIRLRTLAVE